MTTKGPQQVRYALLMYNAEECRIDGTATPCDVDGARRLARSVLALAPHVAYIDIHAYDDQGQIARQALARVDLDQEWANG